MEKKVTMKSTKQEIMDAYEAALKALEDQKVEGDDPEREAVEKEKADAVKKAEGAVSAGIFSNDIIEKYNAVMMAIKIKKDELEELYGIVAKANSMAAMINADKKLSEDIKEARESKKAEFESEIAIMKQELADLDAEFERRKTLIDERAQEYRENVIKKRAREEEEYTYNIGKQRAREKDLWEAEKAAFDEEMKKRQAEITAGMEELASKREELEMLQKQVEQIPSLVAEAEARGADEKEKSLGKQYGYEKAVMKKEYEHKVDMAEAANENLIVENKKLQQEVADTKQKLDEAYSKINTLAAETVKASSGIRIVESAAK